MGARPEPLASSRLGRLVGRSSGSSPEQVLQAAQEHCELCNEVIPSEHRHLLDLATRELVCICRACKILFDRREAGAGNRRLVPDRRLSLVDFAMDDVAWEELRIPVEMAFFFNSSKEQRVMAFYPSPMGPTESLLGLEAWGELETANPVLTTMEPDVEALLVNRSRGARGHWIVPLDECFALVGLIRRRWRGLTGGKEVWEEIARFFEGLEHRSRPMNSQHDDKPTATASAVAEGS